MRYWFNRYTGLIHKSSCANCFMTPDGYEKRSWEGGGNRANWWGPYETLGAAIDAISSTGSPVRLCRSGCGEWPQINPTE